MRLNPISSISKVRRSEPPIRHTGCFTSTKIKYIKKPNRTVHIIAWPLGKLNPVAKVSHSPLGRGRAIKILKFLTICHEVNIARASTTLSRFLLQNHSPATARVVRMITPMVVPSKVRTCKKLTNKGLWERPSASVSSLSIQGKISACIIISSSLRKVIIGAVIAIAFLTKQTINLAHKESQYEVQAEYIKTLDDLFTSVRAQRHDLINHLQTLSGFIQLGDPAAAQEYLQELLGETLFTPEVIIQGAPGLSALLYIKQGKAAAESIEFRLNISGKLTDINVPPFELNRILGNIINNAFDHVQTLDVDQRLVQVDIDQDEKGYYFRIANSGTLNQETRTRIFDQGFSTKKDNQHSGLGLFIVKSLVQKHNGSIVVDNSDDMVTFTVFFPRKNTAFMPAGTVLDLHK
jgi:two-component system sensor histidine kinase AgrC